MATDKKTSVTPKRTTARKANPERPPKPEFVLIEDNLHYSPDGVREIVITVDPEWGLVEPILTQADDSDTEGAVFRRILDVLYGDDSADIIRGLKTSQFFTLAMRWMDEFVKNMGLDSPGE